MSPPQANSGPVPTMLMPYVRQPNLQHQRMCGAASLAMIYRYWAGERASHTACNGDITQASASAEVANRDAVDCHLIWSRIATADGRGGSYARCHRLAADLCHAGIAAAALQAASPWEALVAAFEASLPTIVNFRLAADSPLGHFAVVTAVDTGFVSLHDPQDGPQRRLDRAWFTELWTRTIAGGETVGAAMIVATRPEQPPGSATAWLQKTCPGCKQAFPVPPVASLLDAIAGVFCPWCDRGWRICVAGT